MSVLGLRCSNKDYTYVILTGSRNSPKVIQKGTVPYPQGYSTSQSLKWFHQEIENYVTQHDIKRIVIKADEGIWRGKKSEDRIEHEAIAFFVAANHDLWAARKRSSTLAKALGLKGRGRYLAELDTSPIPDYDKYSGKMIDALRSAWSEIH